MLKGDRESLDKIAEVLVKDMFQVSAGETLAITVDSGSYMEIAQALFEKAESYGGLPMLIHVPKSREDSEAGMEDWPAAPLMAALQEVDIWIEMGSMVMLYSRIWEEAMDKNKKLRYLILGDSSLKSLERVLTGYDIPLLGKFLTETMSLFQQATKVRITSSNGTDVSYLTDPNFPFDMDDGDYSQPIFGTAPGYVNIVPRLGSMEGRIVFDNLQHSRVFESKERIEFVMKGGEIAGILGTEEATKFQAYLSSFGDPNMYKISHNMIGLNPGVRTLSGEIVEDERIWGGVDFGFGHTSPIDMPPHGQVAKSHFDGIVARTTIYLDDIKIMDEGKICHPSLIPYAEQLVGHLV